MLVHSVLLFIAVTFVSLSFASVVDINLEAPWRETPFLLNLIESAANINERLYYSAIEYIIGEIDQDSDSEDGGQEASSFDDDDDGAVSDLGVYKYVASSLDASSISFLNFSLVYKVYSPRIQAHYDFYNSTVAPEYLSRIQKQCASDSFGNQILSKSSPYPEAWLLYNDKLYCSPDEVFALQTDSKSKNQQEELTPFDRIIGTNEKAPILFLYGNVESPFFREMLKNLYLAAKSGKLRFVWRYIHSFSAPYPMEQLSGYGIDLTFKRTDYIAIDDRDAAVSSYEEKNEDSVILTKEQASQLGIKLAAKVLKSPSHESYDMLREFLEEFPNKVGEIAALVDKEAEASTRTNMEQNEKIGLSAESIGIYLNGAPINRLELDAFTLVDRLKHELDIVQSLVNLGFSVPQSKKLVSKFALLSAVKQAQYYQGNTVMGNNENRFKFYQHAFVKGTNGGSGGIVYFNDIENDENYREFPSDRLETYTGETFHKLRQGQIPPLKENVHDIIFAINVGNKEYLRTFFSLSKLILDRSLPQQLGLLPLRSEDPASSSIENRVIRAFYFITDTSEPQESLAFLYQFLECKTSEDEDELISKIEAKIPKDYIFDPIHETTQSVFAIDTPSVILNGVINDLTSPSWQKAIGTQITQDVKIINNHLLQNGEVASKSLRSILYENAGTRRNLKIIPTDLSTLKYKSVSQDLFDNSRIVRKKSSSIISSPRNFWLVGDFNTLKIQNQLIEFLKIIRDDVNVQLRFIHTSEDPLPSRLEDDLEKLTIKKIDSLIESLTSTLPLKDVHGKFSRKETLEVLARNKLPSSHSFILFNARYLRIDECLTKDELLTLIKFESLQRLNVIEELPHTYYEEFSGMRLHDFNRQSISVFDWFDLVVSQVTKSFYVDETLYLNDVARFDFNMLDVTNSFTITENSSSEEPEVDVLLIIDPIDEYSQKVVSLMSSIQRFSFVRIRILLQPNLLSSKAEEDDQSAQIKRFYRGVYPTSVPEFDSKGVALFLHGNRSLDLPKGNLFTTELDIPANWIATVKHEDEGVDLDNIQSIESQPDSVISGSYELRSLLIEGFARERKTGLSPSGLVLDAFKYEEVLKDTSVMSTLGYFQLQADPGLWKLTIKEGTKSKTYYSVLSANTNAFDCNTVALDSIAVPIFDLKNHNLRLRVVKNDGYEEKSLFDDAEEKEVSKGFFGGSKKVANTKQADINIFSIVSGHLYERFLSIMTSSVRSHSKHSVKFWIIENYLSSNFKNLLPYLAAKYDFEYELITYKWPKWLRQQREKQRTIWGYKILFLDVIFPQELDKVIFVDADQIVRTDMINLVNEDLNGHVYGFAPMGESREEMQGYRFWKQGYWSNVLGDTLKYHISALFVVDLKRLRQTQAGDKLRSHYQKLSSDPNSLANLDQDLPNNLQRVLPIHSLDQDWLWCETWCSDESLKRAKTIDLCNNPLTKEPKLERAKRQIPEWTKYDDEVSVLVKKMKADIQQKAEQDERERKMREKAKEEEEAEKEKKKQEQEQEQEDDEDEEYIFLNLDDDGIYDEL